MQRYKCFGCGKSGDVYTFLEEYEGMTFREALESLAETAGITLTAAAPITQEDEERGKLLEVLDLARAYYHYLLTEHAVGVQAREYLKKRGLRQESIKQFQLGVALSAWDGLVTYLHFKKKYPLELIVKAGLASKSENGRVYDKFRSRVMFPLKNHRGQVVGFSGRIYGASKDEKDAPKYMNTPETTLYHKSQLLFGLYENLQTIRKERKVVVVEGEFDVISSVEAHMNTVVAIKGSALTADHVKILSRSVDQIILSLDADEAGIAATRKAIDVVATHQASREVPLTLSVLRIPNGKDPDEFSKSDPKGWRELVKKPSTAYEFLLAAACEKYDPTAAEGKLQIMTELAPVLSKITHAVQYEYYTKFLAERLGATLQSVQNDIKNYQLRNSMKTTKTTASSDSEKQPGQQKKATQSKQQSLESYLFFIACNARPQERAQWLSELQPELLVTPGSKQFLEVFSDPTKEFGEAGKQLPEDLQEVVFELATNPQYYASVETLDLAQEWKNTLKDLKAVQNKQVGQQIEKELEELDRIARKTAAQEARQAELLQQLVLLKRK
jgi:DNA primase